MAIIDKPSDYFNTKLYTGNATNPTTISGIGFQPDWVWTKLRAGGTEAHRLCDAVRGVTKDLFSDASDAPPYIRMRFSFVFPLCMASHVCVCVCACAASCARVCPCVFVCVCLCAMLFLCLVGRLPG